jgi:hypothetical protein
VKPKTLLEKYAVAAGDPQKVLGERLVPLTLTRHMDERVAERWWVHPSSGVIYKREQFDATGDLVGLTTVIEMSWGRFTPMGGAEGEPLWNHGTAEIAAPAEAPRRLADGYELWRAFESPFNEDGDLAQQWVYSDGVHALSVFRTDGALDVPDGFAEVEARGEPAWAGPGPGTWAFEGDGSSYLVVAEEAGIDPSELLEPFPRGGGASFWERLGSVWSRLFRAVGSLFD